MADTFRHPTANNVTMDQNWAIDVTNVFKNYLRWNGANISPVANNVSFLETEESGLRITNTYAWRDLSGLIHIDRDNPSNMPDFNTYKGNIKQYQFQIGDQIFLNFRLPNDYAANTDLYFHIQWSTSTNAVGPVTWESEITYAKNHNAGFFSNNIILSMVQGANTAHRHLSKAVRLSAPNGANNLINTSLLERDGLLLIRILLANNVSGVAPFLLHCGVDYQSRGIGSKTRQIPD